MMNNDDELSSLFHPQQDPYLGLSLDGARILKKLGEGGMGAVYLAQHVNLEKYIAIKILPPAFTREPQSIERFLREARSAAKLEHPNIVQVFNVGEKSSIYFISMQFIHGQSLEAHILEKKRIPLAQALWVMDSCLKGLIYAHKRGIIHRDIKPDNLMITDEGELKVVDFGLARSTQAGGTLSTTGQIMGTPYFMSPEQCNGTVVDLRTDIYALGITFYYMLSGKRPYEGNSAVLILMQHVNQDPVKTLDNFPDLQLPSALVAIIKKMMEKDLQQRYQNLEAVKSDLAPLLQQFSPQPIFSQTTVLDTLLQAETPTLLTLPSTTPKSQEKIVESSSLLHQNSDSNKTITDSPNATPKKKFFLVVFFIFLFQTLQNKLLAPLAHHLKLVWLWQKIKVSRYGVFFFSNTSRYPGIRRKIGYLLLFFLLTTFLGTLQGNPNGVFWSLVLFWFIFRPKGSPLLPQFRRSKS